MRDLAWTLAKNYSMLMSSRHSEQTQMQYMLSTVYAVCRVWYRGASLRAVRPFSDILYSDSLRKRDRVRLSLQYS